MTLIAIKTGCTPFCGTSRKAPKLTRVYTRREVALSRDATTVNVRKFTMSKESKAEIV